MERKPNILFVVFEGLADTVIDAQVLAHARELSDAGVGDFEIWVVAWNDAMYQRSLARRAEAQELAGAPVSVLRGVRPARPGSAQRNGTALAAHARAAGRLFTHVHARTDYAVAPSAFLARDQGAILLWDCRGDAEAEVDYRQDLQGPRALLKPWLRHVCRTRLASAAQACDRALFVSTVLRALAAPRLGGNQ